MRKQHYEREQYYTINRKYRINANSLHYYYYYCYQLTARRADGWNTLKHTNSNNT